MINAMLIVCVGIQLSIFYFEESFLLVGLALTLFAGRFVSICSVPMISESYSTVYRSMGLAISTAVGRATGAFAPFFLYEIYIYNKWLIFLFAAGVIFLCFLVTLTYPIDMTNQPLDEE